MVAHLNASGRWAPVASLFVVEDFAKIAHVDPATAGRALNEVLALLLRLHLANPLPIGRVDLPGRALPALVR